MRSGGSWLQRKYLYRVSVAYSSNLSLLPNTRNYFSWITLQKNKVSHCFDLGPCSSRTLEAYHHTLLQCVISYCWGPCKRWMTRNSRLLLLSFTASTLRLTTRKSHCLLASISSQPSIRSVTRHWHSGCTQSSECLALHFPGFSLICRIGHCSWR